MYLVINLGLKSIRGIVFNPEGIQVYSKSFPVHTSLFKEKVEQDSHEWKRLLTEILKDLDSNTDLSSKIRYITATTSSSCILGVDKDAEPLTSVLMVSDKRAVEEVSDIINSASYKNIEQKKINIATSSLVPKALWFKKHKPEVFNSVRYWIGAGEFIGYYFTGNWFTDPLNAGKAFYDGNEYAVDLLNDLGVSNDTLPKVYEIGSRFEIQPNIKKKFGFHPDCTYILTTYDAICAVLGSSNGKSNNACDVSGTVTSVRILSDKAFSETNDVLLSQSIDFIGKHLIGASNNLGGGIIEWYKQAFFDNRDDAYFELDNQAQKSVVGAGGMIFLPYLLGERAPFVNSDASGTFFGINRSSTSKDFTRAVFESTAFVTKDLLDLILTSGMDINSLSVSGGLARFDLINQMKADVCNLPVLVIENFESTAIGAFVLMGVANKTFDSIDHALSITVRVRKTINPSEKNHILYKEYFRLYKELNSNLNSSYSQLQIIKRMEHIHQNEIVRNL